MAQLLCFVILASCARSLGGFEALLGTGNMKMRFCLDSKDALSEVPWMEARKVRTSFCLNQEIDFGRIALSKELKPIDAPDIEALQLNETRETCFYRKNEIVYFVCKGKEFPWRNPAKCAPRLDGNLELRYGDENIEVHCDNYRPCADLANADVKPLEDSNTFEVVCDPGYQIQRFFQRVNCVDGLYKAMGLDVPPCEKKLSYCVPDLENRKVDTVRGNYGQLGSEIKVSCERSSHQLVYKDSLKKVRVATFVCKALNELKGSYKNSENISLKGVDCVSTLPEGITPEEESTEASAADIKKIDANRPVIYSCEPPYAGKNFYNEYTCFGNRLHSLSSKDENLINVKVNSNKLEIGIATGNLTGTTLNIEINSKTSDFVYVHTPYIIEDYVARCALLKMWYSNSTKKCLICSIEGVRCHDFGVALAKPGFWSPNYFAKPKKCAIPEACLGHQFNASGLDIRNADNHSPCNADGGYTGKLCGQCLPGYLNKKKVCIKRSIGFVEYVFLVSLSLVYHSCISFFASCKSLSFFVTFFALISGNCCSALLVIMRGPRRKKFEILLKIVAMKFDFEILAGEVNNLLPIVSLFLIYCFQVLFRITMKNRIKFLQRYEFVQCKNHFFIFCLLTSRSLFSILFTSVSQKKADLTMFLTTALVLLEIAFIAFSFCWHIREKAKCRRKKFFGPGRAPVLFRFFELKYDSDFNSTRLSLTCIFLILQQTFFCIKPVVYKSTYIFSILAISAMNFTSFYLTYSLKRVVRNIFLRYRQIYIETLHLVGCVFIFHSSIYHTRYISGGLDSNFVLNLILFVTMYTTVANGVFYIRDICLLVADCYEEEKEHEIFP